MLVHDTKTPFSFKVLWVQCKWTEERWEDVPQRQTWWAEVWNAVSVFDCLGFSTGSDPDSSYGIFSYLYTWVRISTTVHLLRCQAWPDQEHPVYHKFQVLNKFSFKNVTVFQVIFKRTIFSWFYSSICSNCLEKIKSKQAGKNIWIYIWSKQSYKTAIEGIILAGFINVKKLWNKNFPNLGCGVVCQDEKGREKVSDLLKLLMRVFLLRIPVIKK